MLSRRHAVAALGALLGALMWHAVFPGSADARMLRAQDARERPMATDGRAPRRIHGWTSVAARPGRPSAAEVRTTGRGEATEGRERRRQDARERPPGTIFAQPGQVTPEKIDRWRRMPPEERERIRERYRRWKELPPERRERLMERTRRWRELPESDRRFLMQRREMYRDAWPREKRVIDKFFIRWRQLPPERRRALRQRLAEWRGLPAAERDERMMEWPFYNRLQPEEQRTIRWFLFSEPPPPPPPGVPHE